MKKLTWIPALLLCNIAVAQTATTPKINVENTKMKPEMTEFWDPEITVVTPGETSILSPSDALLLFDGSKASLDSNWVDKNNETPKWLVDDNCMTVVKGTGEIRTKLPFEDYQLHIEWRTPSEVKGESQGRGNSGIFMQSRYELQVLDNYENRTYRNGQAGSIYKQHPPLVNVCRKPGEWQSYDVIYTAPRFKEDGSLFTPARITVLQNGVVVQNNSTLLGPTEYIGIPSYKPHGPAPLTIQDHGNPVSYRNIWIRKM